MEITRRFQIAAGHRVHLHESKCRHFHGHNYVIEVTIQSPELDNLGRVMDFGKVKELVGKWLDVFWDHGFIHFKGDTEAYDALRRVEGQKTYVMKSNPTAENMASHLLKDVLPVILFGSGVQATRVTIHETENCKAADSI